MAAFSTEEAVVAGWLCELGLRGEGVGLRPDEISALYQWCCCATAEDEVNVALDEAAEAARRESSAIERALDATLGVIPEGYPSVVEAAECAAALGLNRVDPALITGALVDLQDSTHHLKCDLDDLAEAREKVDVQAADAAALLDALKSCEKDWYTYLSARAAEAAEQSDSVATHHCKIAEYQGRLRRLEEALVASGVEDTLRHAALAAQHERAAETRAEVEACRERLAGYAVPANPTRARAKMLQLKAEVKELQSRLPRYRRVTTSRITVRH
eukprot:TRINITY_DN7791_c0_g1_i1.p1 TRINITY_DN7791_c0_g1~~TRINITY_DN7791_c0_g1_i1.p1  ORF type:complete len:297 (+),score=78.47 TRINITY_DN7791_c0_g1_i1:74-892(+)